VPRAGAIRPGSRGYAKSIGRWVMKVSYMEHKSYPVETSRAVTRNIKRLEKILDRKCRRAWYAENKEGTVYIFGSFCRNYDRLIVTLAYYQRGVGFVPCY
jgi:hypothetical protein